tara:strand:+ start:6271 stop:6528 length:258 start_codon:yes stop_codon:yes gene_type:complete
MQLQQSSEPLLRFDVSDSLKESVGFGRVVGVAVQHEVRADEVSTARGRLQGAFIIVGKLAVLRNQTERPGETCLKCLAFFIQFLL